MPIFIWAPNTIKFSENTNEAILRKLPQRNIVGVPQLYKRKDGELSFQIFQK